MTSACCHVIQQGSRHPITLAEVGDSIAAGEGLVWLELHDPDKPVLDLLQKALGLHELAVEDALSAHQRSKVEDYPGTLYLVMRTAQWRGNDMAYGETHVFCGSGYIAIVHHGIGPGYGKVQERLANSRWKLNPGVALYALLDHIVDDLRPVSALLEDRYEGLESAFFSEGFSSENLQRLFDTKRQIMGLLSVVQPIPEICGDLIRLHPEIVEKELRAYYRDVEDHALRLIQALDRLREMIADAMQLSLATAVMDQSDSVQKLAGWGAILAIPTLVFSLYGMNFKTMPELDWAWGYPVTLAATAAACYWLYRHLKQRGWL